MIALVMPPAFLIWIQHDSTLGLQSSNIDIMPWNRRSWGRVEEEKEEKKGEEEKE